MKKLFTLVTTLLIVVMLFAQSPEKMSFQAVVRDNNNNLITNSVVGIRITILQNSTPVYVENQKPVSNSNGLITIAFGGEPGFNAIDWANGPFFIKSEIDPRGGTNYTVTGTSQLMSVPYAFHAQTASYLIGEENQKLKSADKGVGSQVWSLFGNAKTDPLKDRLGTIDFADMIFVTNNEERIRIKADGNVNTGNLAIDGSLTVKKSVFLNTAEGSTTVSGDLTVDKNKSTLLTGDLQVDGSTVIKGTTALEGRASMGGGADFTGPVDFKDDVSIYKSLNVGDTAKINGKAGTKAADFNGQVTIFADVKGGDTSMDAYPLRVQGSEQGIAVKVSGSRTNKNNYVTFWDDNGIQGRIEGETKAEMEADPEFINQRAFYIADVTLGAFDVFFATWEFGQAIADLASACSSSTMCGGLGAVVCAPIPSLIAAAVANLVLKTAIGVAAIAKEAVTIADFATFNNLKIANLGVTYQSGAGDYAEWLLKADPAKDFLPGEIVGVKAGTISLNTNDADHILVVSTKPIILGNMPEEGKEENYEKVAFMGQVPVKVEGTVYSGDYILASGNNDGIGRAVSPAEMEIEDYQHIVGIAWSPGIGGYANVAVGLNTNDMTNKVAEQAKEIKDLKAIFNQVVAVLKEHDNKLAAALQNIKTDPITPGNDNIEQKIKYYKPKKDQIEEGLDLAEAQLREDGVDVDNHPFFKDMKDPAKKEEFLNKVGVEFDKEVVRKTKINEKKGIKTEKEDLM